MLNNFEMNFIIYWLLPLIFVVDGFESILYHRQERKLWLGLALWAWTESEPKLSVEVHVDYLWTSVLGPVSNKSLIAHYWFDFSSLLRIHNLNKCDLLTWYCILVCLLLVFFYKKDTESGGGKVGLEEGGRGKKRDVSTLCFLFVNNDLLFRSPISIWERNSSTTTAISKPIHKYQHRLTETL